MATSSSEEQDTINDRLLLQPSWMTTESWGLILLSCSAMLFSTMGVFLKLASQTGIPSTELVLIRSVFQGTFIVWGMLHLRPISAAQGGPSYNKDDSLLIRHPFGGSRLVLQVVILRGFFGGLGFIMYFYTIKALPLGDAITLFSLYPIYTIFLAAVFLKEAIKLSHLVATACSIIGAVLISQPTLLFPKPVDSNDASYSWTGYATAAIGSLCGALVMTLVRKGGKVGAHTFQLLASWASFGIVFSIIFGWVFAPVDGSWRLPSDSRTWGYLLAMSSVGTVAHFLFNYAGRIAPAGVGSLVRSSDILWAYLWQVVIFDEVPQSWTLGGVFLVVLSLALVALEKMQGGSSSVATSVAPRNPESASLLSIGPGSADIQSNSRGYASI